MGNVREDGWHVDVTSDQVVHATRVIETLRGVNVGCFSVGGRIRYSEAPKDPRFQNDKHRVFYHDDTEVACFDMWGNLVIYHEMLELHQD